MQAPASDGGPVPGAVEAGRLPLGIRTCSLVPVPEPDATALARSGRRDQPAASQGSAAKRRAS
jgi:hypothetical protein